MKNKINCVLLIDDDEATNYFNQLVIKTSGLVNEIIIKQSGIAALEYLRNVSENNPNFIRPELIFLDINMPAMNGWEFLEEYKKLNEEQKSKVVIVMLTTSVAIEDENHALNIPEVSGFESKPLTKGKLQKIMKDYFES